MPEPITLPTTTAIAIPGPRARKSDGPRVPLGSDSPGWLTKASEPATGRGLGLRTAGGRRAPRDLQRLETQVDIAGEPLGGRDVLWQHIHEADLVLLLFAVVDVDPVILAFDRRGKARADHLERSLGDPGFALRHRVVRQFIRRRVRLAD